MITSEVVDGLDFHPVSCDPKKINRDNFLVGKLKMLVVAHSLTRGPKSLPPKSADHKVNRDELRLPFHGVLP